MKVTACLLLLACLVFVQAAPAAAEVRPRPNRDALTRHAQEIVVIPLQMPRPPGRSRAARLRPGGLEPLAWEAFTCGNGTNDDHTQPHLPQIR
jgi:hypothetical protein